MRRHIQIPNARRTRRSPAPLSRPAAAFARTVAKVKPTDSEVKAKLARAKSVIRPEVRAAFVISEFGGHPDVAALAVQLEIGMNDVRKKNLRECEANAVFPSARPASRLRGASLQVPKQEWFSNSEAYMRMALKAQSQCRATLETLATIKNPPVVFARQANIAQGPQQVNNQIMLAAELRGRGENRKPPEQTIGGENERLDTRTPGAAVGANPAMAALENTRRDQSPKRVRCGYRVTLTRAARVRCCGNWRDCCGNKAKH